MGPTVQLHPCWIRSRLSFSLLRSAIQVLGPLLSTSPVDLVNAASLPIYFDFCCVYHCSFIIHSLLIHCSLILFTGKCYESSTNMEQAGTLFSVPSRYTYCISIRVQAIDPSRLSNTSQPVLEPEKEILLHHQRRQHSLELCILQELLCLYY